MNDRYPTAEQFLIGNFHQNWTDIADARGLSRDVERVLREAIAENPVEALRHVATDVHRMLAEVTSEEALRKLLRNDMGVAVEPKLHGTTMRGWLTHVVDLIDAATAQR